MASATIHLISDIYTPNVSYDYFIIPSRVVYDTTTEIYTGLGWGIAQAPVTCWDGAMTYDYDYGWGTVAPPQDWSGPLGTLSFTFKNAAYKISTNQFYDFKVDIIDAWAYNGDVTDDKPVILVTLADKNTTKTSGFWVQSYIEGTSGTSRCAGTCTVKLSILDSTGVVQSGSFLFPFTDMDVRYDGTTDDSSTPGQKYSEGIEITSGCSQIYAQNGPVTYDYVTETGTGCWLYLNSGTGSVFDQPVANANLQTYSYSNQQGLGLRFTNGHDWNENETLTDGVHTGIVGLFTSGATIIWTGSRCGTSLQGKGMLYEIHYLKNVSSFITDAQNMPDPNPQYKIKGKSINLSSNVPVPYPDHTSVSAGTTLTASFDRWSTRSSGSGTSYNPGDLYTADEDLTLYAQWDFTYTYTIAFNMNTGYGIKGSDIVDANIVYPDVAARDTINLINEGWRFEKLGNDVIGWASTPTGSKEYDIDNTFVVQASATYYAVWTIKSHTVKFHDGYTSGNDVIKTVTVTHGESVASGDIPVPGQTYSGRKFEKGGFYRFAGWSGSTSNILDNTDLVAMWEFIPIWVMKNGQWVKYEPHEA